MGRVREGRRPKRYKRAVALYANGQAVNADRRLADAIFLHRHPGWSWDDLQNAPSDVVALMRLLDQTEVKAANARAQRG